MTVSITAPLAAPANPAAALNAGGSLTVAITYYYRITALKSGLSSASITGPYGAELWGLPCTEVSATPTSGNQTIDLTWDAVTGATGYEVYRTEVSGDYDPDTAHLLSDPAISERFYASTETNSFSDDGVQEISACLFLENGLPMAVLTSSTEGSPDTEDDIYDALIAGGYSNHTARVCDQGLGNCFQYHFLCNIDIQGWFKVQKGKQIYHEGSIKFGNSTAGWSVGDKSGVQAYQGSSYFRNFVYTYFANYTGNIIKFYDSYIKDLRVDYSNSELTCGAWYLTYSGKFYCENSILRWLDLQLIGNAEGEIIDSYLQIAMQSSSKVFMNKVQYTRSSYMIYCYNANQNMLLKNMTGKSIVYDIYFHKDSTAVRARAVNHGWEDDPPSARAVSNPSNLIVEDALEYFLKIEKKNGDALAGAAVKITDAQSNVTNAEVSDSDGNVYLSSGTATSGGSATLTDTGKSWTVNALSDYVIEIYEGTGSGQEKSILSNTATIITVKGDWETQPDNTSKYRIVLLLITREFQGKAASPYYDTTTYLPLDIEITKAGYQTISITKKTVNTKIIETINMERIPYPSGLEEHNV